MTEPVDNKNQNQPQEQAQQAQEAPAAAPADRSFITGGLLKGLAVTALVFIGVLGLIAGTMGTGAIGGLKVDDIPVRSFGEGLGHGIAKAAQFLFTSGIGLATLAAGGALGVYREYKISKEQAAAAPDSQDHTKILELAQELESQKCMNKQLAATQEKLLERAPKEGAPKKPDTELKPETAPNPANQRQDGHKQDSIYLAGSVTQDRDFRAGELKRRIECAQDVDTRVV